jgi:hypothetical protein
MGMQELKYMGMQELKYMGMGRLSLFSEHFIQISKKSLK